MVAPRKRPEWWDWELKILAHAELSLDQRDLTELDLRQMFWKADRTSPDPRRGRFRVDVFHRSQRWVIVVEPVIEERQLVVLTIYEVDRLGE
ncbi:MAG TPA: hypothetical protein VF720_01340 [Candidatus Eisenbacteria bacterium]